MDKMIIDIVLEEKELLAELGELDRRIAGAEAKKDLMYELFVQGVDEIAPYIEQRESDIAGMYNLRRDYENQLHDIRKRMSELLSKMVESRKVTYATPRLRPGITLEEAKDIIMASQEKLRRRRATRGGQIRKGRAKYVKTNKVQN